MGSLLDCLAFQPLKLNAGVSLRLFYASPLASANWVCSGGEKEATIGKPAEVAFS